MKQRYFTFCLLLFTSTNLRAQELVEAWARTAGGTGNDVASAIAVDHKGGIYIAGSFESPAFSIGDTTLTSAGGSDIFVARYDTAGNFLWVKKFGGTGNESVKKMVLSADGSIYIADAFYDNFSLGTYNFLGPGSYLAKLDDAGNLQWAKRLDGLNPDITTDVKNNLYLSFEFQSGSVGNVALNNYAPDGSLRFSRVLSSNQSFGFINPLVAVDKVFNVHVNYKYDQSSFSTYLTIFDSTGIQLSNSPFPAVLRENVVGYIAHTPNQYYYSSVHFFSGGTVSVKLSGPAGYADYTGCQKTDNNPYALSPTNTDIDNFGNQFVAGQVDATIPCKSSAALLSTTGYSINTSVGSDIFISQLSGAKGVTHLSTTKDNGHTNELPARIAIDTIGQALYVVGSWSKLADTSKLRFGNSVLANPGNIRSSDILILKFKHKPYPLTVNAGNITICYGGSGQLNALATGGVPSYTYSWFPAFGLNDATIKNPVVKTTASRDYILTVTDAMGASAKDTVHVRVDNTYRPVITPNSPNPQCAGAIMVLESSAAASYAWSNGQTGRSVTLSRTDTLHVTTVTAEGCTGTSVPYIAAFRPAVVPLITQSGNQLSVSPASAYQWYLDGSLIAGANSPNLQISKGGNYSVQVTDANGCKGSTSKTAVLRMPGSPISYQVYPNPSAAEVHLIYDLPEATDVTITLNDINGRKMLTIAENQLQVAGEHHYVIRGSDVRLQKGYYFIVIKAGTKRVVQKILILR